MFFILSKVIWFVLSPFNLALFALTGAMIAMHQRMNALARKLGVLAWALLMIFGVLPVGPMLTHALEARTQAPDPMPRRVDGIIVLGGAINTDIGVSHGRPQLDATADRINAFVELGRRYPWAKLVFTGGIGNLDQTGLSEGQMVTQVLAGAYGFNPGRRLVLEDASRTTYENVLKSKDMVQPKPGQVWLVVTSAWHMPRALGVFRAQGWDVQPYPTDYMTGDKIRANGSFLSNMMMSQVAVKELLGTAMYAISGKWVSAAQPSTLPADVAPKTP